MCYMWAAARHTPAALLSSYNKTRAQFPTVSSVQFPVCFPMSGSPSCEDGSKRLQELFTALVQEGTGPATARRATALRCYVAHRRGAVLAHGSRPPCATCDACHPLPSLGIKDLRALCHAANGNVSKVTAELIRTVTRVKLEQTASRRLAKPEKKPPKKMAARASLPLDLDLLATAAHDGQLAGQAADDLRLVKAELARVQAELAQAQAERAPTPAPTQAPTPMPTPASVVCGDGFTDSPAPAAAAPASDSSSSSSSASSSSSTTRRTGVGPGRDLGRPEPVSQTPTWTGLGALRSGYSAV